MYLEKTGHIILQEEKLTAQQKAHPQFVSFDIYIYRLRYILCRVSLQLSVDPGW